MKVFISHAFGGEDERLGGILKEVLEAAGMDGYMAERAPKYNRLISDKIRRELDGSDWLVAVLTERGNASASVHEEIGYALGRGAEVALMVKKGVEMDGVLVHGREPLVFTPTEFKKHSLEAVEFIMTTPTPRSRRGQLGEDAMRLLADRNIASETSPSFAQNRHFDHLYNPLQDVDEKSAILFTACPHDLATNPVVTTDAFIEWVKSTRILEVEGHRIPLWGFKPEIDIGSLTTVVRHHDAPPDKNVLAYREFHDAGLFECGTSSLYLGRNNRGNPLLHLCYMIGNFWGFLLYTCLFYQKIGMDGPFTAYLSIRNSSALALSNHGDEAANPNWGMMRGLPLGPGDPVTARQHVQLPYTFGSAREMTDSVAARTARDAARMVCNAYGQSAPKCYNSGGEFAWKLWEMMSPW